VCYVHNRDKCVLNITDTFVYVKITGRNVLQIISRFSGQFNLVMSHWIVQPEAITDNKTAASAPQADPPIYRCGTLTDNRALVSDTHLQQSNMYQACAGIQTAMPTTVWSTETDIICYAQRSKMLIERKKTTTTRCGIRETGTTRNILLWLFLNNHNALWHVKICHDAKVV